MGDPGGLASSFSYPPNALGVEDLVGLLSLWGQTTPQFAARVRFGESKRNTRGVDQTVKVLRSIPAIRTLDAMDDTLTKSFRFQRAEAVDLVWEAPVSSQSPQWIGLRQPSASSAGLVHHRTDLLAGPVTELWVDLPGVRLAAAWRMWFGPGSRQYLPVDRLLAFDRCHRNELLDDGTVFIELYGDPLAFADPENRARQAAFREHMEFDRLRVLADELRMMVPQDPVYEIYSLPGRRYHLVTWLDDRGRHVPRSQATHRWTCLQEKDGTVIEKGLEHPPYRELGERPS